MSIETPVDRDSPLMKAWEQYKASEDFNNTKTWAAIAAHTVGSLWAAFSAGFAAALPPARSVAQEAERCPTCDDATVCGDEWHQPATPHHAPVDLLNALQDRLGPASGRLLSANPIRGAGEDRDKLLADWREQDAILQRIAAVVGDEHIGSAADVEDQVRRRIAEAETQQAALLALVTRWEAAIVALQSTMFTTMNDYKDDETIRGRFAKACPYLSAYSVERMVSAFCDEFKAHIAELLAELEKPDMSKNARLYDQARLLALAQTRIWEPNEEAYRAAVSVYVAAFGR